MSDKIRAGKQRNVLLKKEMSNMWGTWIIILLVIGGIIYLIFGKESLDK